MSSFKSADDIGSWHFSAETPSFFRQFRKLAAKFHFHYGIVHQIGTSNTLLKDATYVSLVRDIEESNWTSGDFIGEPTLNKLLSGNSAVSWQKEICAQRLKQDPLSRLGIRFGVSVPFHNAQGNHAALSLFDRQCPSVNLCDLSWEAMPLIDAILTADRAGTKAFVPLSARETGCLQWAAAGKTSIETAMIMGLSPHTVNQYLTAAAIKLEAVNRTHAVTKAVRLGLINLSAV